MQPKPHLAACSAFWADLGVSVEDQHAAASWAFCVPAVASEAGCMELPEDRQWTFNAISTPASLDKPKFLLISNSLLSKLLKPNKRNRSKLQVDKILSLNRLNQPKHRKAIASFKISRQLAMLAIKVS